MCSRPLRSDHEVSLFIARSLVSLCSSIADHCHAVAEAHSTGRPIPLFPHLHRRFHHRFGHLSSRRQHSRTLRLGAERDQGAVGTDAQCRDTGGEDSMGGSLPARLVEPQQHAPRWLRLLSWRLKRLQVRHRGWRETGHFWLLYHVPRRIRV